MELLLERTGFVPFTVASFREAHNTLQGVAFSMVIIDRDFDQSGARELVAQVHRMRCEDGVFVLMLCEVDCDGASTAVWQAASVDYCLGRRSTDQRIKSTLREVRSVLSLRHDSAYH
jgi:DNA-binding response OmpR family regulator